jgi:hypothetical protein
VSVSGCKLFSTNANISKEQDGAPEEALVDCWKYQTALFAVGEGELPERNHSCANCSCPFFAEEGWWLNTNRSNADI